MKKALSIVLSIAMLMTCIFSMAVIPASALNGIDYLAGSSNGSTEDVDYVIENGVLTFNATAAGQEVALVAETPANLNDFPYFELTINSTGAFDLCFNDANNNKWIGGASDFNYNFDTNSYEKLPAGTFDVKFSITGAYTWTGAPLPANAEIAQIIIIAEEPGTITVSKCAMTDGVVDENIFPENQWGDLWENFNNYIFCAETDASEWIPTDASMSGNSDIVVTNAEIYDEDWDYTYYQLQFGNTNGGWPSASLELNKKVDYYTSAIDLDLDVLNGAKTTLYVFFGDATPTDFEGEGKAYGTILSDASAGHYYGTVMLSDILPEDSDVIDENGMVNVSYIKIFASSDAAMNPAVTVNYLDLCFYEENPAPEGLGDIDYDGDVDTYDSLVCFNAAMGVETITLTEEEYDRADVDRDYYVTVFDALYIFFEAAGLPI